MKGAIIIKSFYKTYQDCFDLVNLYECPDCNFCCTKDDIYFSFYELKAINRNPDAKHTLKNHAILTKKCALEDLSEYKFNVIPCPFLNSKCTIYKERPFVCKMYPISVDKARFENAISIDPCPLGINIMLDFASFVKEKTNMLNEYLPFLKMCLDDAPYYKEKKIVNLMDIGLENITDFLEYIKTTPANVRKEKRKEILKLVEV